MTGVLFQVVGVSHTKVSHKYSHRLEGNKTIKSKPHETVLFLMESLGIFPHTNFFSSGKPQNYTFYTCLFGNGPKCGKCHIHLTGIKYSPKRRVSHNLPHISNVLVFGHLMRPINVRNSHSIPLQCIPKQGLYFRRNTQFQRNMMGLSRHGF